MDVKDIAERLHMHPASVRRYIRSGRLRATALEAPQGIRYSVSEEDLLRFLENPDQQPARPSLEDRLQDIVEHLSDVADTMAKRIAELERENREVWRALENLTQVVTDIQAGVHQMNTALSTLTDARVKERDEQLMYAMKAISHEKKRRSLFNRL